MTTLVWFRQDLRLADNPALTAALTDGAAVIPVYIFAPEEAGDWAPGGASRWVAASQPRGARRPIWPACCSRLCLAAGSDSLTALLALAKACRATRVVWNRRYEPALIARDQQIKASFARGPDSPPRASTAGCCASRGPSRPRAAARSRCSRRFGATVSLSTIRASRSPAPQRDSRSRTLAEVPVARVAGAAAGHRLGLPGCVRHGLRAARGGACVAATIFSRSVLMTTARCAMCLRSGGTSQLSPHLHFGEIGPREVVARRARASRWRGDGGSGWRDSQFLTELGWREFGLSPALSFPEDARTTLARANYSRFPWKSNARGTRAWTPRPHRLPHRRCRHAPVVADRLDAQPRAHDRGLFPHQGFAGRLDPKARAGSGTPWSTPTSPATHWDGNGWPGCGARCRTVFQNLQSHHPGGKNSIRKALIFAVGCRNWPVCPKSGSIGPRRRLQRCLPQRVFAWEASIRARSSNMTWHDATHWLR